MVDQPVHEPTTLQARAEVVGYPEPLLEAVRELVREIELDPDLAFASGVMMGALKDEVAVERRDGRHSDLMHAIGILVTIAAGIASLKEGSNQ